MEPGPPAAFPNVEVIFVGSILSVKVSLANRDDHPWIVYPTLVPTPPFSGRNPYQPAITLGPAGEENSTQTHIFESVKAGVYSGFARFQEPSREPSLPFSLPGDIVVREPGVVGNPVGPPSGPPLPIKPG
jgi:hypothetical protein